MDVFSFGFNREEVLSLLASPLIPFLLPFFLSRCSVVRTKSPVMTKQNRNQVLSEYLSEWHAVKPDTIKHQNQLSSAERRRNHILCIITDRMPLKTITIDRTRAPPAQGNNEYSLQNWLITYTTFQRHSWGLLFLPKWALPEFSPTFPASNIFLAN